jgi:acyl-coenzyme A thioesterase PaaI-like protein
MTALQDLYPDDFAHCYGCGRLNTHGLHVKTEWQDGEGVAHFQPAPHHIALPGFVYGGLLASHADCHAIATAAGATMVATAQVPGRDPTPRFVTASLNVDFLRPTPLGPRAPAAVTRDRNRGAKGRRPTQRVRGRGRVRQGARRGSPRSDDHARIRAMSFDTFKLPTTRRLTLWK